MAIALRVGLLGYFVLCESFLNAPLHCTTRKTNIRLERKMFWRRPPELLLGFQILIRGYMMSRWRGIKIDTPLCA